MNVFTNGFYRFKFQLSISEDIFYKSKTKNQLVLKSCTCTYQIFSTFDFARSLRKDQTAWQKRKAYWEEEEDQCENGKFESLL